MSNNILPEDSDVRKGMPICTGVIDYFPAALAAVAEISRAGNDKHNPGQPLNWSRNKSLDHADCIARHLVDRGGFAEDGSRHSANLAWRALALLQDELEREGAPVPKTPRLDGRGPAADAADEREKKLADYYKIRSGIIASILADQEKRHHGPRYIFEANPDKTASWIQELMDAAKKDVRVVTGVDAAMPGSDKTPRLDGRGPAADAADEREKKLANYREIRSGLVASLLDSMWRTPSRYFFESNPDKTASWVQELMDSAEKDVRVVTGIDKAEPGSDKTTTAFGYITPFGRLHVVDIESEEPLPPKL